jgi:hypothetical protein
MADKHLSIVLPEEDHWVLRHWCVEQDRSVSSLIRELIEAYFETYHVREAVEQDRRRREA